MFVDAGTRRLETNLTIYECDLHALCGRLHEKSSADVGQAMARRIDNERAARIVLDLKVSLAFIQPDSSCIAALRSPHFRSGIELYLSSISELQYLVTADGGCIGRNVRFGMGLQQNGAHNGYGGHCDRQSKERPPPLTWLLGLLKGL